jgi:hypothetical protein
LNVPVVNSVPPIQYEVLEFNPPPGQPMSADDQKKIPYGVGWISKARECLAKLLPDDQER